MGEYYYDFHIHSCLSPCADNDMTPGNIAGMASLAGLQVAALTDHNTTRNCPAFFAAAAVYGLTPVAGAELTTAEDIHLVCLFPGLTAALEFDKDLQSHRALVENRVEIFGEQIICGEDDSPVATEKYLLPNATDISVDEAPGFVSRYGGVCYPAHIDRQSNGIVAVLGVFPDEPPFPAAEVAADGNRAPLREKFPALRSKPLLFGSDAHTLTALPDASHKITLHDPPSAEELLKALAGGGL